MSKKKIYAIIDLETTGGVAKREKITEIAIVLSDGEKVIDSYSTLVNPERSIPTEITRITGITNEMVVDSPKFYEIAKDVVEFTTDTIFVAHNVEFDYSFLKEEFARLGYTFTKAKLCTVRLSRKAFPGLKSYSLGNLIQHFNISVNARHRALDDAMATSIIFHKILNEENSEESVNDLINMGLRESRIPKGLKIEQLQSLPESEGVYYFLNSYKKVIYVGKSINIKKRVFQHFTKNTQKSINMGRMVNEISFELTGNELVALLLESAEIKALKPELNKAQKNRTYPYFIYEFLDDSGYINFGIAKSSTKNEKDKKILGHYTSKLAAKSFLSYLRDELILCGNKSSLENTLNSCHYYQLNKCFGACINGESIEDYNIRASRAIEYLNQKFDTDFLILGKGRNHQEKAIVLVEDGYYRGYGYVDDEVLSYGIEEIKENIKRVKENPETNRIIRQYIEHKDYEIVYY
ncbi:MAG TPA: exonuclease domain-containing protein [Saprospiraceae bacterium]|nr:3'-5' exoribonuclease [Lewinellaceae bacterium]HRX29240.1 exonuclease domain-containing protein [Saprospiraceae bacterium]